MRAGSFFRSVVVLWISVILTACGEDTAEQAQEDLNALADTDTQSGPDTQSGSDTQTLQNLCEDGLATCDGLCVDLFTDRQHCGGCGQACAAHEACVRGACGLSCPPVQLSCGERCVTPASDPLECGRCGNLCELDEVCANGDCGTLCPANLTQCERACADTTTDPAHCGGCDQRCQLPSATAECGASQCIVWDCFEGFANCNDQHPDGCEIDTTTDPLHCGGCGQACAPSEVCAQGRCQESCPEGQEACGGGCHDLASSPAHCGGCDQGCAPDEVCNARTCTKGCSLGAVLCGDQCVDLRADLSHCGACNQPCADPTRGTATCNGGQCTVASCEPGAVDCDHLFATGCEAVLSDDANNCGACGNVCGSGSNCQSGLCACNDPSQTMCDKVCVNLDNDTNHCGTCDTLCELGLCAAGFCCTPPPTDCGGAPCKILFVNAKRADGGDGSSWCAAFNNLQNALAAATPGTEIWVAAGTYYPVDPATQALNPAEARLVSFHLSEGVALYGGFGGGEDAREQRNPAAFITILSGDIDRDDPDPTLDGIISSASVGPNNSVHVVYAENVTAQTVLDGFTITAGHANVGCLDPAQDVATCTGAGMYTSAASPTLANLAFIGNKSTGSYENGGALDPDAGSTITLRNAVFEDNLTTGRGGAISNRTNSGGFITVIDARIANNTAERGGAFLQGNGASPITFINTVFEANVATENLNTFIAYVRGNQNPARLINCVIRDHAGTAFEVFRGTVHAINTTFINNAAPVFYIVAGGGTENSTVEIHNSIFWGNPNPVILFSDTTDAVDTLRVNHSLLEGSIGAGTTWNPQGAISLGTSAGVFEDLGGNVSSVTAPIDLDSASPTYLHLVAGSAAINAGDLAPLTIDYNSDGTPDLAVIGDFEGLLRSQGGAPDLGPFERE